MKKRVVITGIGIVAPCGASTGAFWDACLLGQSVASALPLSWGNYYTPTSTVWAPLPQFDCTSGRVSRVEKMQIDTASVLGLCATAQALEMAGITVNPVDPKKNTYALANLDPSECGVFMGTGIAGITSFVEAQAHHCGSAIDTIIKDPQSFNGIPLEPTAGSRLFEVNTYPARFNPFAVSMIMPNSTGALMGIKYGLLGPNVTFANACAAGSVAIGHAFRDIREGRISMALAGGVEFLGDMFGGIFRGFDTAKTLVRNCENPATANRPFDESRSGFLFAEGGCAVLVCEEFEHALKRNAPIIAEIAGYAETFDAHSVMALDPGAKSIKKMIADACFDANVTPEKIDYVNAHGTGTQQNDPVEARVIMDMFGKKPFVNTTKSLIGHTIGASGAIECAVTALTLKNQIVHTCANLEKPIADLNFVRETTEAHVETAFSESFAFGGHNAGLVLKRIN